MVLLGLRSGLPLTLGVRGEDVPLRLSEVIGESSERGT
jgi:hypothetical protein